MREQIEQMVVDFEERQLPEVTPRRLELPSLPGKVDAIVGMRRAGKTYFVFQKIRELLDSGIGRDRVLYLNFEDERLLPLETDHLQLVPEAFYRRYPASRGQRCWFFFDEIQNVPGWERFVRRLLDAEQVSLVVTGSSARLLGREIATSLRGRSLTSELLPFSFEEALRHAGVEVPERWPPPAGQRSLLENRFLRYLRVGGFPEVQGLGEELRIRILQDYVDVVLFRDVAERHGVENLTALRYLQRSLLARPAGRFTIHRLYNDLKSQGVRVAKDSLYDFLGHFEDAFLLFTTSVASRSVRARQTQPRKCYPVDPALAAATSLRAGEDTGHLLENAVYLELRRRGWETSYVTTRSGYEVDFLARDLLGRRELVQVCAGASDPETRGRELRALAEAVEETDVERAVLVTLTEDDTAEVGSHRFRLVPAWRWMLEPTSETSTSETASD
jgi:predicted AAA+ superfamily ATPase